MSQRTVIACHAALAALLALGLGTGAHAQRVTRDTQTGQLRAPTADEAKAMDAHAARSKRSAPVGLYSGKVNPQPVLKADGAVMQELDTSSLMYSVARRNADGSVSQYCVNGEDAAMRLVKGKQAKTQIVSRAGKEQSYELK